MSDNYYNRCETVDWEMVVPRAIERHVPVLPRREGKLILKASRRLLSKEELFVLRSAMHAGLMALSVGDHWVVCLILHVAV